MRKRAWEPPLFEWSAHGPVPVELGVDLRDAEGVALAGSAENYRRRITVDSTLPTLAMRVTLFHEWLHLWAHDTGFDQIVGALEEPFVQGLATALAAREDFHASGGVPEQVTRRPE